jgi:hypothetical protein
MFIYVIMYYELKLEIYCYQYISVQFKPHSYIKCAKSVKFSSMVALVSRLIETRPHNTTLLELRREHGESPLALGCLILQRLSATWHVVLSDSREALGRIAAYVSNSESPQCLFHSDSAVTSSIILESSLLGLSLDNNIFISPNCIK